MKFLSIILFVAAVLFSHCTMPAAESTAEADARTVIPDTLYKKILVGLQKRREQGYDNIRSELLQKRSELRSRCSAGVSKEVMDSARHIITEGLVNGIIPYWYGTEWDFNGYTDKPGEGFVACGYFVSTTMKHAGFNLNRYTLAQQSPYYEAISLSMTDTLYAVPKSENGIANYMNEKGFGDGLYFAGLDIHVGYLYKTGPEVFFIHSNYIDTLEVMAERADSSRAFNSSSQYFIAPITSNDLLVTKWIMDEPVAVIKPEY